MEARPSVRMIGKGFMPLPGSTASGLLTYNSATPGDSSVAISASPNDNAALISALNTHEFQLMTSDEINDWINDVWVTTLATYSGAVSIFEALGGGQLTPTASDPIWSDRSSFGGDADVLETGFGLRRDGSQNTLTLPIASYELDGFERAIARQAKANSTFWSTINSHQSASTESSHWLVWAGRCSSWPSQWMRRATRAANRSVQDPSGTYRWA